MQLYGLVGPSGSGKSHLANQVAEQYGIFYLIDDGLLIFQGRILAGTSAKFERHAISAVKRAIFLDLSHQQVIKEKLDQLSEYSALLILGTSQKMVETICRNLSLQGEIEWIFIQDFASDNQMKLANRLRAYGMHAMPVAESTLQEPKIHQILQRIKYQFVRTPDSQRSVQSRRLVVVNPLFSGGAIYIHPRAIRQSVTFLMQDQDHPFELQHSQVIFDDMPILYLRVRAVAGVPIHTAAKVLLNEMRNYLMTMLGLPVIRINLYIESLIVKRRDQGVSK